MVLFCAIDWYRAATTAGVGAIVWGFFESCCAGAGDEEDEEADENDEDEERGPLLATLVVNEFELIRLKKNIFKNFKYLNYLLRRQLADLRILVH